MAERELNQQEQELIDDLLAKKGLKGDLYEPGGVSSNDVWGGNDGTPCPWVRCRLCNEKVACKTQTYTRRHARNHASNELWEQWMKTPQGQDAMEQVKQGKEVKIPTNETRLQQINEWSEQEKQRKREEAMNRPTGYRRAVVIPEEDPFGGK